MTILEKLQDKYSSTEGIDDARNIAEALACIHGAPGRGAGAIADYIYETCDVTLDAHGGTFKDGSATKTIKVKKGSSIELPTADDLILPANKEFLKDWALIQSGGEIDVGIIVTSPVKITKDCTIRASYGDDLIIYFDPNGGEGTVDPIVIHNVVGGYSFTYPSASTLTPPEGKIFAGWGSSPDTTPSSASQPGSSEMFDSAGWTPPNSKTYYAIWESA